MDGPTNKFILTGPSRPLKINPKGLGCELYECMVKHKDRVAQIDSETGLQDTFGALSKRVVRTAIEMRKRGITSEDMVTLCTDNHVNSVVPFMASLLLKVKVSCLDPSLSVSDTAHLLGKVQPKMIFLSSDAETLVEEALEAAAGSVKAAAESSKARVGSLNATEGSLNATEGSLNATAGSLEDTTGPVSGPLEKATPEIITFGRSGKFESFINFLRPSPKEEEEFAPVPATDLKEAIVVLFSSGTTGLPKGISLHHHGLLGQANFSGDQSALADFTMLNFASLYWISAVGMVISSTRMGCKRLLVPRYERKMVWEVIKTFKPTVAFLAPCTLLDLVKEGPPMPAETTGLYALWVGGSAITKDQLLFARRQLPNTVIIHGLGMTEISGGVSFFDVKDPREVRLMMEKPSSCGVPLSGIYYKIVDPESNEILGPNQQGELRLKSDYLLNGYYNQDSSGVWDEDGWLKTGDVMYYDEDNCLFHVDRIKEMLKYKSWHVVPAKLEEVIARHPEVLNVVVVGIPHPEDGDHPCGVVILKKDSKVTPEELRRFADDQLEERQKLRGGIKFVEEFPLTPTGKIKRVEVRNLVVNLGK